MVVVKSTITNSFCSFILSGLIACPCPKAMIPRICTVVLVDFPEPYVVTAGAWVLFTCMFICVPAAPRVFLDVANINIPWKIYKIAVWDEGIKACVCEGWIWVHEEDIPQNTRSSVNENYNIPISIVRLLPYTKEKNGNSIIGTWK